MAKYKFETLLDSVDSTQSGSAAGVAGYRRLGLQIKAALVSSGSGIFKLEGTINGTDWKALALIDTLANTNSQTLTRVLSKTISSNVNTLLWVDGDLSLRAVRATLTWATDGSYSAYLIASE